MIHKTELPGELTSKYLDDALFLKLLLKTNNRQTIVLPELYDTNNGFLISRLLLESLVRNCGIF